MTHSTKSIFIFTFLDEGGPFYTRIVISTSDPEARQEVVQTVVDAVDPQIFRMKGGDETYYIGVDEYPISLN